MTTFTQDWANKISENPAVGSNMLDNMTGHLEYAKGFMNEESVEVLFDVIQKYKVALNQQEYLEAAELYHEYMMHSQNPGPIQSQKKSTLADSADLDELKRRAGITEEQLNEVGGNAAHAAAGRIVQAIRSGQAEQAVKMLDEVKDGGTAALTSVFVFTSLQQTNQASAWLRALQTISEDRPSLGGGVPGTPGYMRKYGGPENAAHDAMQALRNEDPATAEKVIGRVSQKQAMSSGLRAAQKMDPKDLSALLAWLSR